MVLDTSAIVAAIANEPDGSRYRNAMLEAGSLLISSVTVLETRVVLHARQGAEAVRMGQSRSCRSTQNWQLSLSMPFADTARDRGTPPN